MSKPSRIIWAVASALVTVAIVASAAGAGGPGRREVNGIIWAANRGADTIRGFDAATGAAVRTVPMRGGAQPGDLAYAKGKLYVAEEFGSPPAIAIVDAETGAVLDRIFTGPRPHHVHASVGGNLIAYGVFGTNRVGVIDTQTDTLLGEWSASMNPAARSHAGVFSPDGHTLYVANDVVNELSAVDPLTGDLLWTMTVPNAHELFVTHNGKIAYV
ncbi:MAG: YncE family protein, partial [Gaiellaceae bacterium]